MSTPERSSSTLDAIQLNHPRNDFIDNRLPQVDGMFSHLPPVQYHAAADLYTPQNQALSAIVPQSPQMKNQADMFLKAVHEYERSNDGKTAVTFKDNKTNSWDDVLRNAQAAEYKYRGAAKKEHKGVKGEIRGLLRGFSRAKGPVESWMRLLPSESWQGSLLCGGVSIVLEAAGRLDAMREDTYAALEEIPISIEAANTWVQLNFDSPRRDYLEYFVSQLFVEILKLLESTIRWYATNPLKKFAKAVFLGDDYSNDLSQIRERMDTLRNRVKDEATMNRDVRLRTVEDQGRSSANILNRMAQLLSSNEQRSKNFEEKVWARHKEELAKLEAERLKHEAEKANWEEERKKAKATLEEGLRIAQEKVDEERRIRLQERRDYVLRHLRCDPDLHLLDLKESLMLGPAQFSGVQDRTAWIMRSTEVGAWLDRPQSRTLIINGNEDQHEKHSAVSFFSAMALQALLSEQRGNLTLFWFCGQQASSKADVMMRSLIYPLVKSCHNDIPPPELDYAEDLVDFEELLECFLDTLEEQLRFSSVFIVLDSISFYEDRRRKRQMHSLIDELLRTARRSKDGPYWLKLLLTSPIRSGYYQPRRKNKDSAVEVLEVPDLVDGDFHTLTELDLAQHIESFAGAEGT